MNGLKNKYGFFSEDGREFVITDYKTPRPWVNILSNGHYGLVISQTGGGFSWLDNSNLNRLTRWQQDLIRDDQGKYLYLRDEESGEFWSPSIFPTRQEADRFACHHGIGYTTFVSELHGIRSEWKIFVPLNRPLEIWTLKLTNLSNRARNISVFTYLEWLLGAAPDAHREFHKTFIETRFDSDEQILFARKRLWEVPARRGHWNTDWPYVAFMACSLPIDGFDSDKESFLGMYGSLTAPRALKHGKTDGRQGKWLDPIASLHKQISLAVAESCQIHFFLGAEKDEERARQQVRHFRAKNQTAHALQQVSDYWDKLITRTTVQTPDPALNLMSNIWLKYQAIAGRLWGRAAYYQQSGAYGFRDQLQDSQIFLYLQPEQTKEQILLHAAHQFTDGRVLHWWHPLSEQGLDAQMSDDLLWLPFVVIQYLKETADWDLLKLSVPFYDTATSATVEDHCLRAIHLVLNRLSPRGLPLILHGDWNDGLSAVGLDGKGESVWLGHFLFYILNEFSLILRKTNRAQLARFFAEQGRKLKQAINKFGWDGDWYWRASKDNGDLIGSKQNKEGQIYLNAQTWAIIAGTAGTQRQNHLMDMIRARLNSEAGPLLFAPAYSAPDEEIGYLSRYAPGIRENGGVYTHAATWLIRAANRVGDRETAYETYRKICPAHKLAHPDVYKAEPYVTPGNLDGPDSPFYTRGGWTWYTGSAAWLFKVTIDDLIGIQADYDGLRVNPNFPKEWQIIRLQRFFRGRTFHIEIETVRSAREEKCTIFVDGSEIPGDLIPARQDHKNIQVVIKRYLRE